MAFDTLTAETLRDWLINVYSQAIGFQRVKLVRG